MWPTPSAPISPPAVTIDPMADTEEQKDYSVWVDWEKRVISFSNAEGFEEIQFPTREEKLQFAVTRGNEGFGIQ